MTISEVLRNRFKSTEKQSVIMLRNGQIVQGKILKLYPGNRAKIQINGTKMIAEIGTPLRAGDTYFFQVEQAKDQLIHLKVISDFVKNEQQNISNLVTGLGVSLSRPIASFVKLLINEKIPFEPAQLTSAIHLLDKNGYHFDTLQIVKEMIANRLPMTDGVYQALFAVRTHSFSNLLTQMAENLHQSPLLTEIEQQLFFLIENMLSKPTVHSPLNTLLKLTNEGQVEGLSFTQLSTQITSMLQNPTFLQTLSLLKQNQLAIQEAAQHIIKRYPLMNDSSMSLKEMINEHLRIHLPHTTNQVLQSLGDHNRTSSQIQLVELLHALADESLFKIMDEILTNKSNYTLPKQTVQQQFMFFVSQYLSTIGMNDEYIIKNMPNEFSNALHESQLQTIKSYLLQVAQGENGSKNNQINQMIHFINGLQIQSVQETAHFIHATLQMPGAKFALNKDLFMQFEGKKTDNGQLDPNHCRILFILHLKQLQETIIDMTIQKRIISISIYNDFAKIRQYNTEELKRTLTTNLERLDFQLSSVKWKQLHHQKENHNRNVSTENSFHKEGFDMRI